MSADFLQGMRNIPFLAFSAGFLLLTVHGAERSGLPPAWAATGALLLIACVILATVIFNRTSRESLFMLASLRLRPLPAGLLLGVILSTAVPWILQLAQVSSYRAATTGMIAGILLVHLSQRYGATHETTLLSGLAQPLASTTRAAGFILSGLLMLAVGLVLSALIFPSVIQELTVLTGMSAERITLLLPLAIFALFIAGGGHGLLAALASMVILAVGALLFQMALGSYHYGAPPLPSLGSDTLLAALAEARHLWLPSGAWPPLLRDGGTLLQAPSQAEFAGAAFAALLSALITRLLSPALPVHRRTTAISAALSALIVGLMLIGIAGYAVSAALVQFANAGVLRPPAALFETLRTGQMTLCGQVPLSSQAIRDACAIIDRQGTIPFTAIRLDSRFLLGGLPVALGIASGLSAWVRSVPVLIPLIGLLLALWMATLGLARGLLAVRHLGPGQSSLRLAYMRVAAALVLFGAMGLGKSIAHLPMLWTLFGCGVAMGLILLLDVALNRTNHDATDSVPHMDAGVSDAGEPPAVSTPRRRRRVSAPRNLVKS